MFKREIWVFIVLAYMFSGLIFMLFVRQGAFDDIETMGQSVFFYMWGPFIAATLCNWKFRGRVFARLQLKPSLNVWMFLAWAVPITAGFISLLASKFLGAAELISYPDAIRAENLAEMGSNAPDIPDWFVYIVLFLTLTAGAGLNALFSISEELGWRGYLLRETTSMGFWKQSVFIGIVWGIWHTPIILAGYNYPGAGIMGVLMITGLCLSLSPVINLITIKAGNIWAACIFHGCFNTLGGITLLMTMKPDFPWSGIIGLGGILGFLCFWPIVRLAIGNTSRG